MKKEENVRLSVRSVLRDVPPPGSPADPDEETSLLVTGHARAEGDTLFLHYRESGEGGEVRTYIRVQGGDVPSVTADRRGASCSHLVFAPGEDFRGVYEVPPCRFDVAVQTHALRVRADGDGGEIAIEYRTEIGGVTREVTYTLSYSYL